jgi:hypothetical protein
MPTAIQSSSLTANDVTSSSLALDLPRRAILNETPDPEEKDTNSYETSGTTHPVTQIHIPENVNPLQYRCENL